MIKLTLPWPPSVNRYWRHPSTGRLAGRHLISSEGRAYRESVLREVLSQSGSSQFDKTTPLKVEVVAYRPDHRKRDLDNLPKAIFDSLTHAGVWCDDSQITDMRIMWGDKIIPGGLVEITIERNSDGVDATEMGSMVGEGGSSN